MGGFDCVFVGFVNDDYVGVLVDDQQDFVDYCEDGGNDKMNQYIIVWDLYEYNYYYINVSYFVYFKYCFLWYVIGFYINQYCNVDIGNVYNYYGIVDKLEF